MKPSKKRGKTNVVALALCFSLLGGMVGGGAAWYAASMRLGPAVRETTIQVSESRSEPTQQGGASGVSTLTNGKRSLTEAEIYASQVGSVVSINVTGESGYNYFGQPVQTASSGSGFILTKDGYIVTNYHVVESGKTVKVTLYDNSTYDAKIIGGDADYDIAVLKIEGADFQAVTVGDSSKLKVGDHVAAIGNPLGELTFSMSEGIASSVNRAINVDGTPFNMIQVTCAINPGNSGGPLFNEYGEAVGIVSAKYSTYSTTTVEGLGFAIPINDVLSMIEDIMTNGYVANKPYLGIFPGTFNSNLARQYQFDVKAGVIVYSVEEGSAADKAGLKRDDVITKVDDQDIKTVEDLNAAKKKYSAGDKATLTVYRDGQTITVDIIWDAVPAEEKTEETQQQPQQQPRNNQGGQYGNGFPFNDDFFNYFFGNGFFGR
ncbi:MAG: trypsin-like peptidase domain-containing protein [Oscillibacter sp.]|nr:trypsin-like peptidase domain-containing protein [Oscillibacter sp.]